MDVSFAAQEGMRLTNELFCSSVVRDRQIDDLDEVYTIDARILPPGAEMVSGRAAIKAFWKHGLDAMGVVSATLNTVSAEAAGDGVVEIGQAVMMLAGSDTVSAKYVVHWKEDGGAWKWQTDIWNINS